MNDQQSLLDQIEIQLRRHSYLVSDEYYTACTLWPVGTFLIKRNDIPIFDYYGMLGFMSVEPDSGKTQALDVVAKLSYNAIALGSYTPAVCLSKIDRTTADDPTEIITIPFDDLDTKMGYGRDNSDLVMLFNEGYRRGSVVSRCDRFKDQDKDTPAYCPKCFSALSEAKIPLATLTRTIAITMRPWAEGDPAVTLDIDYKALADVNRHIAEWSEREDIIASLKTVTFGDEIKFLSNRNLQIWRPLLAIAKITSSDWYDRALRAARFFTQTKQTSAKLPHKILALTFREFVRNRNKFALPPNKHPKMFHCADLADELATGGEIPRWVNGEKLAGCLTEYSLPDEPIHTRQVKISGHNRAGMHYHTLYAAWKRYLPMGELRTIMAEEGLSDDAMKDSLSEIGLSGVVEVAKVAVDEYTLTDAGLRGEYVALPLPSLPALPH